MRNHPFLLSGRGAVLSALAGLFTFSVLNADAHAYTLKKNPKGISERWTDSEITVIVDKSVTEAFGPDGIDAVRTAFGAWTKTAGAFPPAVNVQEGTADDVGYHPGQENHNTIRYAPEGYEAAGAGLGITIAAADETGRIVDADIIMNGGAKRPYKLLAPSSADPTSIDAQKVPEFDFQNVVTHEIGHFFGLGEEPSHVDDTMFPSSQPGEVKKRNVEADDAEGFAHIYSQPQDDSSGGCSVSSGSSGGHATMGLVFGLALAQSVRMRRRKVTT